MSRKHRVSSLWHRRSIPSHLHWRSALGSAASWSGSGNSSRGVVLLDSLEDHCDDDKDSSLGLLRPIGSDKRMFHLPCSLLDRIMTLREENEFTWGYSATATTQTDKSHSHPNPTVAMGQMTHQKMKLLPHPRIVGPVSLSGPSRLSRHGGIACMELDGGHCKGELCELPPRYLLVGSDGNDCSIAKYDLLYFGSDEYLNHHSRSAISYVSDDSLSMPAVTYRPISRSIRNNETKMGEGRVNMGSLPSGHRYPLLGTKWYPADNGSFVSASISGEILVWDAKSFVPVFATSTHVHTRLSTSSLEVNKAVAPLQCMDLPKSPHACPHGQALLALGLGGGDGRSVIQLCDAFSGGSATHELVGHDGGVNVVAWDPCHPFRLASGGEDGTVRLWDVRKVGPHACLGVLNKDRGYFDQMDSGFDLSFPPLKQQRAEVYLRASVKGIESHSGPVSASIAASVGNKKGGAEKGGLDPAVACGGRLFPHVYGGGSTTGVKYRNNLSPTSPNKSLRTRRRMSRKSSIAIVQLGSRSTSMLFSTSTSGPNTMTQIFGYPLYQRGSKQDPHPEIKLQGHLDDITCLTPVSRAWDNLSMGSSNTRNDMRLLSGGKDGIVLTWGIPVEESSGLMYRSDHRAGLADNRSDILSVLRRQSRHGRDRVSQF
ncbi:hypothetical protein HJC23_010073 [Cyclotella cryptica]|uniref:Uncharacterized protein n=1 Tax=Cyclotella cryptica TaxID=29204 RepID=A0ABD3Q384_9STRA